MTVWLAILTVAVLLLVIVSVVKMYIKTKKRGDAETGVKIRWNLLAVLVLAYGSIGGLFLGMVLLGGEDGMTPKEAYDNISVPFVALVGGSLAVAKDLISS